MAIETLEQFKVDDIVFVLEQTMIDGTIIHGKAKVTDILPNHMQGSCLAVLFHGTVYYVLQQRCILLQRKYKG